MSILVFSPVRFVRNQTDLFVAGVEFAAAVEAGHITMLFEFFGGSTAVERNIPPIVTFSHRYLLRRERRHVDEETVLHVGLQDTFMGLFDLLDRNEFHIGGNVVTPAEFEHLLGFSDAADGSSGEAASGRDLTERCNRKRCLVGAPTRVRFPSSESKLT